jgi:hypothetical protein
MDYKELFKLISELPDGELRDLSEVMRKNLEAHPNLTYEDAKAQIERFNNEHRTKV